MPILQDDAPYQVEMEGGFKPYRRNIRYLEATHLEIRPMLSQLSFIQNKQSWGGVFRYGFLEIDEASFRLIAEGMLGVDYERML